VIATSVSRPFASANSSLTNTAALAPSLIGEQS